MRYLVILLLQCCSIIGISQTRRTEPKEPTEIFPKQPDNYVTDRADILSLSEQNKLNKKLRDFEDKTTNQLFVYIANSLDGKDLEDFSREIFNTWGVGQKDKNNGILIAIFIDDRVYRIQVGTGLEETLPSDVTRFIQDDHMRPHFREGNYYGGIDAGIDKLIHYSENELTLFDRYREYIIYIGIAYAISFVFYFINMQSLKKWKNKPKRRNKNMLASTLLLLVPGLGTVGLIGLCWAINDKGQSMYYNESDDEWERRMQRERERELREDRDSSSSDNDRDTDFGGGGGGSSDDGGSSSSW